MPYHYFSLQYLTTAEAHSSLIPEKQGRLTGAAFKATEKKGKHVEGNARCAIDIQSAFPSHFVGILMTLQYCNQEIHFTLDGLVLHSSTHTPALQIKLLNQHFSG